MRFTPLGDRAVTITIGERIDEATHRTVRAVCARLTERPVAGVLELVPAFASVVVHYDPLRVPPCVPPRDPRMRVPELAHPYERFISMLSATLHDLRAAAPAPSRLVEIPVLYGGEGGPDLEEVARHHALDADSVVRMHAAGDYLVHMVGFAPGFAYLGGLAPELATPRRDVPRTHVPAGSVGIGGAQTGVYPVDSPGGWRIIGRTMLRMFDAARSPASLLQVGDRVRFRVVTAEEASVR